MLDHTPGTSGRLNIGPLGRKQRRKGFKKGKKSGESFLMEIVFVVLV